MTTRAQQGYLVLADISGYTSFMAATELDHAHEIMSELLEVIVKQFCPALTLSKLEGDAVFVYAPEGRLCRGETLLELLSIALRSNNRGPGNALVQAYEHNTAPPTGQLARR